MTSLKGDDGTSAAANETITVAARGNASQRAQSSRQPDKHQVRHRASVACASCRDRRIRCVVPKGESECVQCKKAGNECIIKNDDERRRPISKAYMSSLSDRIAMLEGLLLEKGVDPPPAAHPPRTRRESQPKGSEDEKRRNGTPPEPRQPSARSPRADVPSPPDSASGEYATQDSDRADSAHAAETAVSSGRRVFRPLPKEQSPFRMLDPKQEDIVHRLLSTKGNLSFDQLSGRLRFFGPTANSHVYAESCDRPDSREPPEQVRRAERIVRSLTAATHEYLAETFWAHYNSVLQIVHRDAFDADKESQNPRFYSSFLHICMLAMAFRFADSHRDDMKRIALGARESTLHREAKYMLDIELERPGGIPSVQALLLLGDLECGVGRDNTGWMYAGMANRLAFDIGLHLDTRNAGISEQEVDIRHMVMRACVIYDRYWALFLGRPTSIKNQDIGMDLLSRRFSQLTSLTGASGAADEKNIAAEIYDQLIELMELAGRIVESREDRNKHQGERTANAFNPNEGEDGAYLHTINLDRQLQNWYRRLPEHLQWKPSAIRSAPFSYFLLHQQYHVSMILLHRPWAKYGAIAGDGSGARSSHPSPAPACESNDVLEHPPFSVRNNSPGMNDPHSMVEDSRTALSRSICTQQAIRVARVFWQHRQRFDGTKIFVTGIQHAGTAAIALIAALAYNHSESDRRTYLGYLEILSSAVSDMSHTYQPAARMDDLLKAVLVQLRADINDLGDGRQPPVTLTGGDKSLPSGAGWSGSVDSIYSILPARRDADAGSSQAQAHKRRRPSTSSRRASEFTRPPPPFFLTQAQATSSARSSQSHRSVGHHPPIDPAMYSIGSDDVQGFNLDFLNGSAIDHDLDDASDGMVRPSDDFVLVASQNEGWALSGMGRTETPQQGGLGYHGVGLSDWAPATAEASAGAALVCSDASSSARRGKARGEDRTERGNSAVPRGPLSDQLDQMPSEGKEDETEQSQRLDSVDPGGMDWMGSEGGLNAMSPVSLSGLVQCTIPERGESESAGTHRNHELDFFSF